MKARLILAVSVALAASCGEPLTEVLIVIDSDLSVPAELDEVRVDLIGPDASLLRSEGGIRSVDELPRTLAVVWRGGELGPVRVTVTGFHEAANVVQRRASFWFVRGEVRVLRLDLLRSCVGMSCGGAMTCGPQGCRAIDVREDELLPYHESLVMRFDAGPTDGGLDAGPECVPMEELCNGEDDDCDETVDEGFDLTRDTANCGACGNACSPDPMNASSTCESSACQLACDPRFDDCNSVIDDGCEAVLSEPATCGACGTSCGGGTPFCMEGPGGFGCVTSCSTGLTECGGSCVDVGSDSRHCGGCGAVCAAPAGAVATCVDSACGFECDPGFADCNVDPSDGCESDLRELSNCGSCGVRCELPAAITSCVTGVCELIGCDPGRGDCDADDATGCEQDIVGALAHCGMCGSACPADPSNAAIACVAGACELTCDPGFDDCDGDIGTGCDTAISTDVDCGACGVVCGPPTPLCEALGVGGYSCTDGCSGTTCAGSCVDTSTDISHCGGCSMPCPAGPSSTPTCMGGACGVTCDPGFGDCDMSAANGCEVSLPDDPMHCGACAMECPAPTNGTATCAGGSCGAACDPGFRNCDGDPSTCETDIDGDVTSCGACGAVCMPRLEVDRVDCVSATCVITSCVGAFADCDGNFNNGCERDTDSNRNHCGGCDNRCPGGQVCCGGGCVPTCP